MSHSVTFDQKFKKTGKRTDFIAHVPCSVRLHTVSSIREVANTHFLRTNMSQTAFEEMVYSSALTCYLATKNTGLGRMLNLVQIQASK